MSFIYTWGDVLGPVAAGFLYDRTQTYNAILWTLVVVLAIASGACATLTKPQHFKDMTHD
jgi:cyanate permease